MSLDPTINLGDFSSYANDPNTVDISGGIAPFDPTTMTADSSTLTPSPDYTTALDSIAPGITSNIAQVQQPGQSWTDTLQSLLPTLATTYQQYQLLGVQVQRAKQGLPPLNVSQYGAGVQVGMSSDTQKTVLMVAGIIAAGIALATLTHSRK